MRPINRTRNQLTVSSRRQTLSRHQVLPSRRRMFQLQTKILPYQRRLPPNFQLTISRPIPTRSHHPYTRNLKHSPLLTMISRTIHSTRTNRPIRHLLHHITTNRTMSHRHVTHPNSLQLIKLSTRTHDDSLVRIFTHIHSSAHLAVATRRDR